MPRQRQRRFANRVIMRESGDFCIFCAPATTASQPLAAAPKQAEIHILVPLYIATGHDMDILTIYCHYSDSVRPVSA